jgi:hypothetical protein
MNDNQHQPARPKQRLPLHVRISYYGVAILFVGLVGAAP